MSATSRKVANQNANRSAQKAKDAFLRTFEANPAPALTKVPTGRSLQRQPYSGRSRPASARPRSTGLHQEALPLDGSDSPQLTRDGDGIPAHSRLFAALERTEMLRRKPLSEPRCRHTSKASSECRRRANLLRAKLVLLWLSILLFLGRAICRPKRSFLFPHRTPMKTDATRMVGKESPEDPQADLIHKKGGKDEI